MRPRRLLAKARAVVKNIAKKRVKWNKVREKKDSGGIFQTTIPHKPQKISVARKVGK